MDCKRVIFVPIEQCAHGTFEKGFDFIIDGYFFVAYEQQIKVTKDSDES